MDLAIGAAVDLSSVFSTMESGMTSAFMSMVDGTMTAKDAFRSMATDIIRELYRVLVVQQLVGSFNASTGTGSGIAGFIGGLFRGRAAGGPVQAGVPAITGEHGRELFVPQTDGRIMTVAQTKQMQGGGGTVNVNQTINVTTGVQQTVRAEIKSLMPQIADSAKAAVLDAKRRGGSYGGGFA
jgi:phage-related minor tail protein